MCWCTERYRFCVVQDICMGVNFFTPTELIGVKQLFSFIFGIKPWGYWNVILSLIFCLGELLWQDLLVSSLQLWHINIKCLATITLFVHSSLGYNCAYSHFQLQDQYLTLETINSQLKSQAEKITLEVEKKKTTIQNENLKEVCALRWFSIAL